MTIIAIQALMFWVPVVIILFAALPPRRAILAAFIGGWMFLPLLSINVQGLPAINKVSLTSIGCFLAVAALDGKTLFSFRPRLLDVPMLAWCLLPLASAHFNGMPLYDGASRAFAQVLQWGIPYLLGRLYFTDFAALREIAVALFIGGVIYVPFCIWEIRMSPQLHLQLYGTKASGMLRGSGLGLPGYRPNVFIGHGLMLGMFMLSATLSGFWLWRTKAVRTLFGLPVGLLVFGLWATTILCKNLSTIMFLHVGLAALVSVRWLRTSVLVGVLIISPAFYMLARASGAFTGDALVSFARLIEEARGDSLEFRLKAETAIIRRAMLKPVFGYGSDPTWRLHVDPDAEKAVVTDGLWIIHLGQGGLVWLAALVATFMIPPLLVWRRTPVGWWEHPMFAGVTGLTMLIICVMIDSLFNVTANLITLLVVGAVTSIIPQLRFPQRGGGSGGTGVARPAQSRWAALSTRRPQRQLNQPVHVREGTAV